MDGDDSSASSSSVCTAAPAIPVDLFVTEKKKKKNKDASRGQLGFADSSGNFVFKVLNCEDCNSSSTPLKKRLLVDSSGKHLFSLSRLQDGSWQGYKEAGDEKIMVFRTERRKAKLTKVELDVFLVGESSGDSSPDIRVTGFPYARSCSINRGESIMAQTSLMHKLHQVFVSRSKYRLTIFPECTDHALIVAITYIFLYGKK